MAVGGEFGTLSEIALALKAGKLVFGLGAWELSRGGERVEAVQPASSPEDAVAKALAACAAGPDGESVAADRLP